MSQALIALQSRVVDAVQGKNDRGATMVEYALLVAFIAIVALVGVKLLGTALSTFFSDLAGDL